MVKLFWNRETFRKLIINTLSKNLSFLIDFDWTRHSLFVVQQFVFSVIFSSWFELRKWFLLRFYWQYLAWPMCMSNGVTHIGSEREYRAQSQRFWSAMSVRRWTWRHTLVCCAKNGTGTCQHLPRLRLNPISIWPNIRFRFQRLSQRSVHRLLQNSKSGNQFARPGFSERCPHQGSF